MYHFDVMLVLALVLGQHYFMACLIGVKIYLEMEFYKLKIVEA